MAGLAPLLLLSLLTQVALLQPLQAEPVGEVRPAAHTARLTLPARLTREPTIHPGEYFVPPALETLPDTEYGEMVRLGRLIFTDTQTYARRYVGNGLNCSNCHLNEGRKPHSAPLWAAHGMYPVYRRKTGSSQTLSERLQDCFRYSMNGLAPTLDTPEIKALVAYSHWLSKDAPIRVELPGRGFPAVPQRRDPSSANGAELYQERCALCHGADGLGRKRADGSYQFPPVWGPDSFNRGAGMNRVKTCAQFVKANMPLGKGGTLDDMDSWDICAFIWIQDRPWDPRRGTLSNLFNTPPGGP
jgi:thiosulfate dehydrogenase